MKKNRENIDKANKLLFGGKCNLHTAAEICGMTPVEMKYIFTEYVKYNPVIFN